MPILTPEERIGSTLGGKYRIERILAAGGMGTVFAGIHEWTHRPVAVKVLNYEHARNPEIVRRFLQEARAAAQLKHENVVDVLDMGQEPDGSVYLVLELLEGETLKARMHGGPLSIRETADVLGPIMRALATAHKKGVVHRDLKPDNIFLTYGESGQVIPKLLDFGIAKVGTGQSSSTRTGTMVGTPHFMAPEQVRGERDVGPAADVWSMGVVLYACLSGKLPFDADSTAAVLAKVITERPTPLLAVAPELPAAVGALVDRALQPLPADRFADIGAMLAALSAAVDASGDVLAPPSDAIPLGAPEAMPTVTAAPSDSTPFGWSAESAAPSRIRSPMFIVATLGLAALLGLAGGAAWVLGSASSDEPPTPVDSTPVFVVGPYPSEEEDAEHAVASSGRDDSAAGGDPAGAERGRGAERRRARAGAERRTRTEPEAQDEPEPADEPEPNPPERVAETLRPSGRRAHPRESDCVAQSSRARARGRTVYPWDAPPSPAGFLAGARARHPRRVHPALR